MALALPALLGCGVWALWPAARSAISEVALTRPETEAGNIASTSSFPIAAFDATLWSEPPPIPVVEAPRQEPAPPPVRLILVGIVRESPDGTLTAALYDEASDQIRIVRDGDQLGRVRIDRVTPDGVRLVVDDRPRTLTLDAPGGTP